MAYWVVYSRSMHHRWTSRKGRYLANGTVLPGTFVTRSLVRYRCGVGDQRTALVVEDAFAGGRVHGPLAGAHATLGELQRLVGGAPAPPPAARAT